jgi:hypothetical protein
VLEINFKYFPQSSAKTITIITKPETKAWKCKVVENWKIYA